MGRRLISALLFAFTAVVFIPFYPIQFLALAWLFITLLSLAWSLSGRFAMTAFRDGESIRCDAYRPMPLPLKVRNQGNLPQPGTVIRDSADGLFFEQFPAAPLSIAGNSEAALVHTLQGYRRGVYSAGPAVLSGSDPLGMFPWTRSVSHTAVSLLIFPEIIPLPESVKPVRGQSGGATSAADCTYRDLGRYRSLRDYQPGDPQRMINWKASARRGRLLTIEYDNSIYAPVWIVLETARDAYQDRRREGWIERAISAAASIVTACGDTGQPVGLLCSGTADLNPEAFSREVPLWTEGEFRPSYGKLSSKLADSRRFSPAWVSPGRIMTGKEPNKSRTRRIVRLAGKDSSPDMTAADVWAMPSAEGVISISPAAGPRQIETILTLLAALKPLDKRRLELLAWLTGSSHLSAPLSPLPEMPREGGTEVRKEELRKNEEAAPRPEASATLPPGSIKPLRLFVIGPPLTGVDRTRLIFLRRQGCTVQYLPAADQQEESADFTAAGIAATPLNEFGTTLYRTLRTSYGTAERYSDRGNNPELHTKHDDPESKTGADP